MAIKYGKTEEVKHGEHSSVAHEYDIASAYPTVAKIIEQIKAQPKRGATNDVTMLGIERELHHRLRQVAALYSVPMGRIAEIAIAKVLDDIVALSTDATYGKSKD
jgi:hypothetical protein